MHSKNIIHHLLLAIISITTLYAGYVIADAPMPSAMPGFGQGPNLEDIKAMEAEIDNFVRTLPPEQQKQFYKDVEELTGIMEKMTPEELNDFVGSVFSEAGLMEQPKPTPPPPVKPAPQPPAVKKEEAKPAVVITTAPSGPTEKAVNMITAIIKRTEEFMRKASMIPEMQVKMNKWVVQKKLLEVTANLDWETVETQIDELNVLLYSLKEKDPVTHQYKHIGNLIKDEALYNNLATLQVTLDAYVPLIYVPDFGLEIVSKESRAAIREVLSQYLESFYLLNVPASIKKVKTHYEPRAKELREEEQRLAEQARKEVEKPRVPAPAVKSPGTKAPYIPPAYTPPSRPEYTPPTYFTPTPEEYKPSTPVSAGAGKAPAAGAAAAGGKAEAAKGEKGAAKAGEEKEASIEGGGKRAAGILPGAEGTKEESKKKTTIEHKLISLNIKIAEGSEKLRSYKDEFAKPNYFFENDINADDPTIKKRVQDIEDANNTLKKSITDIKAFKDDLKKLSKEIQDQYKDSLPTELEDTIKFYKAFKENIQSVGQRALYETIPPNKNYIYFGKGGSEEIKKIIPEAPKVTLDTLKKTIEEFLSAAGAK